MTDSNQKYKAILENIIQDFTSSFEIPIPQEAKDFISKAKRIMITGSGSSYPAAFFISKYLNKTTNKSVILANSSDILDSDSLSKDDLVILISQGWGRADGYLITKKCIVKQCNLIVFTGHPERINTHYLDSDQSKIIPIEIKPNDEKIFCRPNSPLTSLVQVARLFDIDLDKNKLIEIIQAVKKLDFSDYVNQFIKYKNIVILSSSTALAACYNFALALREGGGRHAEVHEMETYGHGWYTIDQENQDNTLYVLIKHSNHTHTVDAYNRIESLIKNTNSNYIDLSTELDFLYGNIYLLAFVAYLIPLMNDITNFDMNNPKGMEENRGFHEIFKSI
jgi:glucosamine 6-phosphate synthetase-like amidotransferase/phosphosugar isomerase protein